jgi:N-acetyl-1-D-myo-inositol-2-amino-2-deoxy-alpha-D-glucopyranoside deacetylase
VQHIILSIVESNSGNAGPGGLEAGHHEAGRNGHVLFVHAHPDDETITTGGTIASLIDSGVGVTVLTCTRGECGEVIPAELKHLEGDGPALALCREEELAQAMAVLGVTDHRYLGAPDARLAGLTPRRYLDSGMRWGASGAEALDSVDQDSLCGAPLGEVAADIATVLEATRATAVISYDGHGGYGHPDHIRAHDAARRAAEVMGVPFYAVQPDDDGAREPGDIKVDVSSTLTRKTDALRAHSTQVMVDGDSFALSSGPFRQIASVERYRREILRTEDSVVWSDLGITARVVACALATLFGLALGGVGTVNHQIVLTVGAVRSPSGVVLALLIVTALMVGLRLVFESRIIPTLAGAGILLAIAVLTVGGPGGSVLVPANPAGYAWTYGAATIVALVLAWPRLRGLKPRSTSPSHAVAGNDSSGAPRDTMGAALPTKGPFAQ